MSGGGARRRSPAASARSRSSAPGCRRSPRTPLRGSQMNSGVWMFSSYQGCTFLPHQPCSPSSKPWSVQTISIVSSHRSSSSMASSTRPSDGRTSTAAPRTRRAHASTSAPLLGDPPVVRPVEVRPVIVVRVEVLCSCCVGEERLVRIEGLDLHEPAVVGAIGMDELQAGVERSASAGDRSSSLRYCAVDPVLPPHPRPPRAPGAAAAAGRRRAPFQASPSWPRKNS